jgi:1,4-alpha-glucan branching enzyme
MKVMGDADLHYFAEGTHRRAYGFLGAHVSGDGVHFAVWAPNACRVSVIGDFNDWNDEATELHPVDSTGVFAGVSDTAALGDRYKYRIVGRAGTRRQKADPFAFASELPPGNASIVTDLDYRWHDDAWMRQRSTRNALDAPISIYEMHLGSWRGRHADGSFATYRELAEPLARHITESGFTHVELLPVMEHPFYGSWGYQSSGYFAPTARYGNPQDLMFLVDTLHQHGIGVIFDWVPSHFPTDAHGLAQFDGTHLYEHADPRLGYHPDWHSAIFNYGRHEVRSFLLSSALFWLDRYHVDGLRVDAVASMLYRDYSRRHGEWIPNEHGGRENIDAIRFLQQLNRAAHGEHPGVMMIAEESTDWPMVSRPVDAGGLGFGFKWDMGWMHDTLKYMRRDPVHRKHHHHELTFRSLYYTTENFVLPLSHDEVVYGKRSLLRQMWGDDWQQRAQLRLLFGYQYTQPGKKLLFAGGELGQPDEWDHEGRMPIELLDDPAHAGIHRWVADLNALYRDAPALHQTDCGGGFEWVDADDAARSTFSYLRWYDSRPLLIVANFTPQPWHNYRAGVPLPGRWRELLNSDAELYGGSGQGNLGGCVATPIAHQQFYHSLVMTVPPLGIVVFAPESSHV